MNLLYEKNYDLFIFKREQTCHSITGFSWNCRVDVIEFFPHARDRFVIGVNWRFALPTVKEWYNTVCGFPILVGESSVTCVLSYGLIGKRRQTMQIIIKGKQMEVAPRLREYIERKVQRLSRLVGSNARIEVTVSEEQTRSAQDRYIVQLALSNNTHPIHSEVCASNANMALDLVLDKVTVQLGRHKDRKTSIRRHRTPPIKILSLSRSGSLASIEEEETIEESEIVVDTPITEERNEEIWSKIMEIRHIQTKPMSDHEVISQMETHGLSFYPFFNEETRSVNVMYRLDGGGFGLLVPALEQVAD